MRGSAVWWVASIVSIVGLAGCGSPGAKQPQSSSGATADWLCGTLEECVGDVGRYPADPKLRARYARVLVRAGKLAAAAKEYRAALKLSDQDPSVIEDAAKGLATLGDPEGCLAELDAMLAEGGVGREAKRAAATRARVHCESTRR